MKAVLLNVLKVIFLLVFPFIVLIRGSVFLHEQYALYPWFSIAGGVLATAVILLVYFVFLRQQFTGEIGNFKTWRNSYWVVLCIVVIYCLPGLLFLSATNAKHPEVRKEFTSLHPILRLGISNILLLDRRLIITDASRFPEDYRKMGLARKNYSLHYRQKNGFAHAVDIRVGDRSIVRNWLLEQYFRAMGFRTLRHVGTADHLHVSLMSHDRPGAK